MLPSRPNCTPQQSRAWDMLDTLTAPRCACTLTSAETSSPSSSGGRWSTRYYRYCARRTNTDSHRPGLASVCSYALD